MENIRIEKYVSEYFGNKEFLTHQEERNGGIDKRFNFPNGYGLSVIFHRGSYGFEDGLYEIALLYNGRMTSNDEFNDVIGFLTSEEVQEYMEKVKAYPPRKDE